MVDSGACRIRGPGMTLHLLRGFVQSIYSGLRAMGRRGDPIKTVDDAATWVKYIADSGFEEFSTVTTRRVRRAEELEGRLRLLRRRPEAGLHPVPDALPPDRGASCHRYAILISRSRRYLIRGSLTAGGQGRDRRPEAAGATSATSPTPRRIGGHGGGGGPAGLVPERRLVGDER